MSNAAATENPFAAFCVNHNDRADFSALDKLFLETVHSFLHETAHRTDLLSLKLNSIHGADEYQSCWERMIHIIRQIDPLVHQRQPYPGAYARGANKSLKFFHWKFQGAPFMIEGFQVAPNEFSLQIVIKGYEAVDPAEHQKMLFMQAARLHNSHLPNSQHDNPHNLLHIDPQAPAHYHIVVHDTTNPETMRGMLALMYTWEQLRLDYIFKDVLRSQNFDFDCSNGFFFYNLPPHTVKLFHSFLCNQLQSDAFVMVEERNDTAVYGDPGQVLTLTVRFQEWATDKFICLDVTFPRSEDGDWIQVHGIGFAGANTDAFRVGNRQHTFTDPVSLDYFQLKLQELKDTQDKKPSFLKTEGKRRYFRKIPNLL